MAFNEVLFRVDATSEVGSGHFYRCLTIAEKLIFRGKKVAFFGLITSEILIQKLYKNNISFFSSKYLIGQNDLNSDEYQPYSKQLQLDDANETLKFMDTRTDLIIVDHYKLDFIWEQAVAFKQRTAVVVLDDLSNRKHNCVMLLDQTFGKKCDSYKGLVNNNCRLLVGEEFTILRDEFIEAKKERNRLKNSDLRVLLSFGGADLENYTKKACLQLSELKETMSVDVIMGPLNQDISVIEILRNDNRFNFIGVTNQMGKFLTKASLVIGASGGSTWERLFVGVPSLQFVVSENQREISEQLHRDGFINLVKDTGSLKETVSNWISGKTVIKPFPHIDGNGLNKVIKTILSL